MPPRPNPSRRPPPDEVPARRALQAVPDVSASKPQSGSHGSPAREQARAEQRGRLALAMIECVAERGYGPTRVADVVERAALSRKTFYEHYANKEELLFATFETISEEALRRVEAACHD